jgi:hypothetical protein
MQIQSPGLKYLLQFAMFLGVDALFADVSLTKGSIFLLAPLADPHSTQLGGPLLALLDTLSLSP